MTLSDRKCLVCDADFKLYYKKSKYCSKACGKKAWYELNKQCIKPNKVLGVDLKWKHKNDSSVKWCSKCDGIKPVAKFGNFKRGADGLCAVCKVCRNLTSKDWLNTGGNKEKGKATRKKYRENNRDKTNLKARAKYKDSPEEHRARGKQYNKDHPDKRRKLNRAWYDANREYIRVVQRKSCAIRRQSDPMFKLLRNVRSLIRTTLNNQGVVKKSKTDAIVGCDISFLQSHLIKTFEINYCIPWGDKYADLVHMDHIYPASLAKDEFHLIELNHYSNLQYLFIQDNKSKGNKIDFMLHGVGYGD